MKVWVSKYALSTGIQEMDNMEVTGCFDGKSRYVTRGHHFFILGKEAHETPEAAKAAAEKMRVKKIASLKKQIQVLEAMTF